MSDVCSRGGGAKYPFQVATADLTTRIDHFIDMTISSLSSFYMELPRGDNYLDYSEFKQAYERLRVATCGFQTLERDTIKQAVRKDSLVLVVLRTIVGLSPPELADLTSESSSVVVDQGFARSIDSKSKKHADLYSRTKPATQERVDALIDAACGAIERGPRTGSQVMIHRLSKVDTAEGLRSVQQTASQGVEYSALLYERLLGRPFATHRDSVSESVGHLVEDAVQVELSKWSVPFHHTGQAERIPGFDQAPDFLVPNADDPKVVIEAKLTQDDGTARDKVTRVQHLDRLSEGGKKFQVVACIDGRGFRIRREDMRKLLFATRGKVFTMDTMMHLVEWTGLQAFAEFQT